MELNFYKYQGAGNDFILVDDRSEQFDLNNHEGIHFLCDRRFGVGADGLMLLRNSKENDFEMIYYNSDGHQGSMCGNGGRCIVAFAKDLDLVGLETTFNAIDGKHYASISSQNDAYWVKLGMNDVAKIEVIGSDLYMNTGSPHYVINQKELSAANIVELGRSIRFNDRFSSEGTNVNFVEVVGENHIAVRTYERGVEDETLACGTGVTAAAIYANYTGLIEGNNINIDALGGRLRVSFMADKGKYSDVVLEGPAKFVFKGTIHV